MISADGVANRDAKRARVALALSVVREHVPRRDAVCDGAIVVFAIAHVPPQSFRWRAVDGDRAVVVLVGTSRGVPKQEKPLLLSAHGSLRAVVASQLVDVSEVFNI